MASLFNQPKPKPKSKVDGPHEIPAVDDNAAARILSFLTPIQQKFVLDESRSKLARCPRRAGKSHADAALMLYTAVVWSASPIGYFGLTRDSAKEAIWDTLKKLIADAKIECEINDRDLSVTFGNKSVIRLFGADMENIKNRFRGRKFKLVIVDECAFYAAVDDLVTSVLSATLMDLQGTLVMSSSPGVLPIGLFYEADCGAQKEMWARYTWTLLDNPHFQQPSKNPKYKTIGEEELDKVCVMRFGGDRNHPEFRREFLGEWVFDSHSLVYPVDAKNIIDAEYKIPKPQYAIGLNLSHPQRQGAVVLKYSDHVRPIQVVHTERWKVRNFNDLAALIEKLRTTYTTDFVYAYLGKGNKDEVLDEFRTRFKEPVRAPVYDKLPFYQTVVATDLEAGHIHILRSCSQLISEFGLIVKDGDGYELQTPHNCLADAFFAVYLMLYNNTLKAIEPEETEEARIERQITERAIEETLAEKDRWGLGN